jgi:hypothetical protein
MSASPGNPMHRYIKPATIQPHVGGTSSVEPKPPGFDSDASGQAKMLDLVMRNGDHTALPYPYLVRAKLIGGEKIELCFTEQTVTLTGRNLGPLYQHLLAQTVRRIEEDVSGFDDGRSATWVKGIVVEDRG